MNSIFAPGTNIFRFIFAAAIVLIAQATSLPLFAQNIAAAKAMPDCGDIIRCEVTGGGYRVNVPRNWDHKTPLPTVFFYHGYRESAAYVLADKSFRDFSNENGILLVVPDGQNQTWSYPGSPAKDRDEITFTHNVLLDVEKRFPVNKKLLWASGFSQGGSMVWYLACSMGSEFRAFAPVSGAFWLPMPQHCNSGAIHLRHIHGTADPTVPMKGRAIGLLWRQADVRESLAIMRETDQCRTEPDSVTSEDNTSCENWSSCRSGKTLKLCLHDSGHFVERRHLEASWAWVKSLRD